MKVSRDYAIHSDEEPERLDRQAHLIKIEQFLDYIPAEPKSRILDAGCGSASMARLLSRTRPDSRITGLDIRESYLDYARRKSREEKLANLQFVHGSLLDLPFQNDSFDVVWTSLVLHWLAPESLDRAMAEIKRVVRPEGWVVCAEPDGVGSNHYPIPADLAEQWLRVTTALFDPDMGRRLYPLMHKTGLQDIAIDIRPYFFHAFGTIDDDVLAVITEALRSATPKISEVLGGADRAQYMLGRLIAQLQRADSVFYPLWFIAKGRKPR